MAHTIKLKRTSTAGNKPDNTNITTGELALNTADKSLYIQTGTANTDIVTLYDDGILHLDDTNNRVGIGTTSPTKALDVVGGARVTGDLQVEGGDIDFNQSSGQARLRNLLQDTYMRFSVNVGGTQTNAINIRGNNAYVGIGSAEGGGSPVFPLDVYNATADTVARFTSGDNRARIQVSDDDTDVYVIAEGSKMSLGAANSLSSTNLTIDSSGNVGIGTTSPDRALHVKDGALVVQKVESSNTGGVLIDVQHAGTQASNAGSYAGLRFNDNGGHKMSLSHITESSGNGYVQIGTSWATGGEVLSVHGNGNVGIGTTAPTYHFHVDAGNSNTTALFESDGVANVVVSGGNNRGSFVVQHSGTTTGAVIAKDGGGLEFGVGANYATNVGMTLDSFGNLSTGQVTSDDKFTVSTSDWYQFTPGTMSATVGSYGMGNGNNPALRQLTFHVPNIGAYSNTGTIPSFGWYSNGADLLMKLESSSGNLTVKGNIVTDSNSTVIAGRKIAARDANGLAIATSDGTERIGILNSGAIRFNNAFTFPTAIGSAGQVLKVPTSGTTLYWADEAAASLQTSIVDADGDTKIQVEESSDEDKIRFDTAGTERVVIDYTGVAVTTAGVAGLVLNEDTSNTQNSARLFFKGTGGTVGLMNVANSLSFRTGMTVASTSGTERFNIHPDGVTAQVQFKAVDGNASTPGISFATDTNTGLFRAGEDTLSISTAGTERVRVSANGNVGIGTTSPTKKLEVSGDFAVATSTTSTSSNAAYIRNSGAGAALVVNQQGTGDILRVDDNSTTKFIVKDGGRVGIGTTAPTNELHVASGQLLVGSNTGAGVHVNSTGSIEICRTAGNADPFIDFKDDSSQDYDVRLQMDDGHFKIANTGGERVRVESGGNVGIGTTSPSTKLEVHGTTTLKSQLDFLSPDGTDTISASMLNTDTLSFTGDSGQLFSITDSSTGTIFSVNDISGVPSIEVEDDGTIRLAETFGNVGIGVETPGEKLDVNGNVQADEFIGDLRGASLFKASAGEAISKGDVVYISGISGNTTVVSKADADDTNKMPAFGIAAASASANNPVEVYTSGILSGIDTSSYSEGDELFVSTTAGTLTATAPTGESAALQKIGKVTRSHASSGSIFIIGAGRSNAVPNLNEGKLFVGNSSNQAVADNTMHVDIANSRVGIGTTSPSQRLQVAGTILADTALAASSGTNAIGIGSESNITDTSSTYRIKLLSDSNNAKLTTYAYSSYLTLKAGVDGTGYSNNWSKIELRDGGGTGSNNAHMKFYTHGDERMVIDNDGNVGIGTTNPTQKLDVQDGFIRVQSPDVGGVTPPALTIGQINNAYQAGITSSIHLSMKAANSSGNFYWYPNSNNPIAILRQNGDFTLGSTDADNYVNTGSYFKPDTNGKFLAVTGSAHGGFLMLESSTVTDNDQVGGVFFTASAGQSDAHRQVAGIDAIVDAHSTNTALNGGDLRFFTKNVGSGLADPRMTIRSSGQVGIGTTTPGVPLDVNGVIRATAGDAGTSAYSITSNGGDLVLKAGADDVVLRTGGSGSEGIYFQDGAQDTKMFINAENGQVGIGTTSPSYNLDIQTTTGTGLNVTDDNDWATIRVDGGGGTDNVLELTNYGNTGSGSIIRTTGTGHLRLYAGNTEAIRIDGSNQKVGIGVTLPTENLDVAGIGKFRGTSESSAVLQLGQKDNSSSTALHTIYSSDSGSVRPLGGDALEINTGRYLQVVGATRSSAAGANVRSWKFTNATNGSETGTTLILYSQTDASSSGSTNTVDRVSFSATSNQNSYINTSGNFGLGTSSPSHKLHVVGNIAVNDNNKIILGGSSDLELYHNATNSYIVNNTGHTYLRSDENNKDVIIEARLGTGNLGTYFIADSSDQAVKLYHGNSQKFATISNGIRVSSNNYGRIQISDNDSAGLHAYLDKSGLNLNITSQNDTGHGGIALRRYNGSTTLTSFYVDEIGDSKFYRDNGSTVGAVFDASTGRFGIGVLAPSEALHVAGDVLIDGSTNTGSNVALLVGGSGNGTIKTRHVDGKDYQSTSDGTLHLNYYVTDNVSIASGGGKVQIGSGVPLARLQVEEAGIDTLTTSTSSASQVAIDTFNKGHFRSAEFTIQVTNTTTSKYHLTKILLIHDGTTPNITEYGTIFTGTGAEATFDADISGNNVRLLATPASANSMTFKVVRHCITV